MINKLMPVFIGSLLFQVIQLGCFPILVGQILVGQKASNFILGLVLAIPWLSVLLFGAMVPLLIRRLGNQVANQIGCLLTVAGVLMIIADESLWVVVASTICVGVGLIIRWVNCDTLVIELSDENSSGRAIGIHEALMGLGLALGPLLFAVASLQQVKIICVLLVLLGQCAFFFADSKPQHSEAYEDQSGGVAALFKIIAVALAAAFVAGFIESSATALFPIHFSAFGFSLSSAAILVSSFGFGGTILQPPLGTLADRKGYNYAQMLCAVIIVFSCIVLMIWATNQTVLLISIFIFGGAVGGLNTLAVMEAGKVLDEAKIPAAMTAIAMLYTLGGVAGPITSASSIDLLNNFGMIVIFMAISALLIGFLIRQNRKSWEATPSRTKP